MLDQSLHRRTPKRALGPKMPSPDPDLRLEPLRLVGPPPPLQWTSCCTSQDRTRDNARHGVRLSHISQGGVNAVDVGLKKFRCMTYAPGEETGLRQ
jgi:hypothetical protein